MDAADNSTEIKVYSYNYNYHYSNFKFLHCYIIIYDYIALHKFEIRVANIFTNALA